MSLESDLIRFALDQRKTIPYTGDLYVDKCLAIWEAHYGKKAIAPVRAAIERARKADSERAARTDSGDRLGKTGNASVARTGASVRGTKRRTSGWEPDDESEADGEVEGEWF